MLGRGWRIRYIRANRDTFKQLVDFLIRHLLSQLCEHISELSGANVSVSLLVEHLESADELLCDLSISLASNIALTKGKPGVPAGLKPSGRFKIDKKVL